MDSRSQFLKEISSAYGAKILKVLTRMLGSRSLAEEMAQDSYLALYENYDPQDVRNRWAILHQIAVNKARDYLRRGRKEIPTGLAGEDRICTGARPDEQLMNLQLQNLMLDVIERLPANVRLTMVMYYWLHMSYKEIAVVLNITTNAVEQRLARGLKQCRDLLPELGFDQAALY